MFRSIRTRLIASHIVLIVTTGLVIGISVSTIATQVLQQQYAVVYEDNARTIYAILDAQLLHGLLLQSPLNVSGLPQLAQGLREEFSVRVRIYQVNGAGTTLLADSGIPPASSQRHLAREHMPALQRTLGVNATSLGKVIVSDPVNDRAYREGQLAREVVWVIAGACLLAVVLGSVLADRLTVPIRLLTQATSRISAGDFSGRVPERQRDEVGDLARQFNRMVQRLEEGFAALAADRDHLRQFVSDVSHELRTPLTALRTFNDLLQNGAAENPVTRQDFLHDSARQIERLDWLTHNLLDLSRLDAGIARLALQRGNLVDTLQRAVETNRPAAAAKDITLELSAQPLFASYDAGRMEQAFSNIVGNAIKFSRPASTVHMRVSAGDSHAVIEVHDEGVGIPPSELPRIFERFYRGQDANRAGDGSGLGLAITKAIIEAHAGTIEVESAPNHGTTIRIQLPLTGDRVWASSGVPVRA